MMHTQPYRRALVSSSYIIAFIRSLHTRYQGVDWRDRSNWGCNGGMAPNGNRYYDGLDLDPYEVRSDTWI